MPSRALTRASWSRPPLRLAQRLRLRWALQPLCFVRGDDGPAYAKASAGKPVRRNGRLR